MSARRPVGRPAGSRRPAAERGLGARCGVKLWFPPAGLLHAAEERTDGLLSYYLAVRINRPFDPADLAALVRSAYLQGCKDTADVAAGLVTSGSSV